MTIHEFVWPQDRINHIARHGVTPEEFEQVCFGRCLVQRAKSEGENPVYYHAANDCWTLLVVRCHSIPRWQGIPGDGAAHD